jgi:hypothetical protein
MTRSLVRRTLTLIVAVIVASSLAGCVSSAKTNKGWKPMLSGDKFDGWYTFITGQGKNNDPNGIFTISNGVLHVYKNAVDGSKMPFGYIATEKEYSDYHLRLQYKWGTKRFAPRATSPRDSGLLYNFTGPDIVWPLSVECQIMETDTGSIYAVGTTVTTTVDAKTGRFSEPADGGVTRTMGGPGVTAIKMSHDYEIPGWNTVEIIVRGDSATYIINGHVNNRCTAIRQPDTNDKNKLIPLAKGKVLLQAEGAEVFYRNVEIQPLPPE